MSEHDRFWEAYGLHKMMFIDDLLKFHQREKPSVQKKLYPNGICLPGISRIFVTTSGQIKICEKVEGFMSIGTVFEGIDYDKVVELCDRYISDCNQNCLDCWALQFCRICFFSVNGQDVLDLSLKKDECLAMRRHWKQVIILYAKLLKNGKMEHLDKMMERWEVHKKEMREYDDKMFI